MPAPDARGPVSESRKYHKRHNYYPEPRQDEQLSHAQTFARYRLKKWPNDLKASFCLGKIAGVVIGANSDFVSAKFKRGNKRAGRFYKKWLGSDRTFAFYLSKPRDFYLVMIYAGIAVSSNKRYNDVF